MSAPDSAVGRNVPRLAVWGLFLISGACGLIYEVLWSRQLGLVFGNTVHSLSAVLASFMAGLALGSYAAGRVCHRFKNPLFVYGVLELAIGVYCAGLPWALSDHGPLLPLYRALYGETGSWSLASARFAISFVLLLIPTIFMGATLPVLSQFLVRSNRLMGQTAGALYAVNSLGAVAGAAVTGFALLPELGKAESNWLAVGCNVVLGAAAMALGWRGRREGQTGAARAESDELAQAAQSGQSAKKAGEAGVPAAVPVSPQAVRLAVITFGVTGFAGMATQIGWTRAISLGTGSSTYAFSLIVAVFILGLSAGGTWGSRMAARGADAVALLGRVLLLIGLFCVTLAALLGLGPVLFFFLLAWGGGGGAGGGSWPLLLALQALGIGMLIIVPTFLMGATMPLTVQIAARAHHSAGRTVGWVYSVNTVGAILGSLIGGLILLPALQIQTTLELMALLYAVPGFLLFRLSAANKVRRHAVSAAMLFGLTLLALALRGSTRWDPRIMSSGSYLLRESQAVKAARELRILDALPSEREILYYREGVAATVAVARAGSVLSLSVGGKPDASNGTDMSTQTGLALVPELIHKGPVEDVLVIGLGSGVSVGAALAPESVRRVDVVEMSPEVVEASWHFRRYNKLQYASATEPSWLRTERLELLINDGRNHLLLSSRKYDVISSEPSNPWMAGVGNLFTKEAFELARGRLKPDGVMCQWVHSYALNEEHFFSIVKTFGEVFPQMQLWWINRGDYLLIGSAAPIHVPLEELRRRLSERRVREWLARVRQENEYELLAGFLAPDDMLRHCAASAPLHTDDNMLLEFSAPRALYAKVRGFRSSLFRPAPEVLVDTQGLDAAGQLCFLHDLDLAAAAREHIRMSNETAADEELSGLHMDLACRLAPRQFWTAGFQPQNKVQPAGALGLPQENSRRRAAALIQAGKTDKALNELMWLMLIAPGDREAVRSCIRLISDSREALAGEDFNLSYLLRYARRLGVELCALEPEEAQNWELLRRVALLSQKQFASEAALYRLLEGEAGRGLMQCNGQAQPRSSEDVRKAPDQKPDGGAPAGGR